MRLTALHKYYYLDVLILFVLKLLQQKLLLNTIKILKRRATIKLLLKYYFCFVGTFCIFISQFLLIMRICGNLGSSVVSTTEKIKHLETLKCNQLKMFYT